MMHIILGFIPMILYMATWRHVIFSLFIFFFLSMKENNELVLFLHRMTGMMEHMPMCNITKFTGGTAAVPVRVLWLM